MRLALQTAFPFPGLLLQRLPTTPGLVQGLGRGGEHLTGLFQTGLRLDHLLAQRAFLTLPIRDLGQQVVQGQGAQPLLQMANPLLGLGQLLPHALEHPLQTGGFFLQSLDFLAALLPALLLQGQGLTDLFPRPTRGFHSAPRLFHARFRLIEGRLSLAQGLPGLFPTGGQRPENLLRRFTPGLQVLHTGLQFLPFPGPLEQGPRLRATRGHRPAGVEHLTLQGHQYHVLGETLPQASSRGFVSHQADPAQEPYHHPLQGRSDPHFFGRPSQPIGVLRGRQAGRRLQRLQNHQAHLFAGLPGRLPHPGRQAFHHDPVGPWAQRRGQSRFQVLVHLKQAGHQTDQDPFPPGHLGHLTGPLTVPHLAGFGLFQHFPSGPDFLPLGLQPGQGLLGFPSLDVHVFHLSPSLVQPGSGGVPGSFPFLQATLRGLPGSPGLAFLSSEGILFILQTPNLFLQTGLTTLQSANLGLQFGTPLAQAFPTTTGLSQVAADLVPLGFARPQLGPGFLQPGLGLLLFLGQALLFGLGLLQTVLGQGHAGLGILLFPLQAEQTLPEGLQRGLQAGLLLESRLPSLLGLMQAALQGLLFLTQGLHLGFMGGPLLLHVLPLLAGGVQILSGFLQATPGFGHGPGPVMPLQGVPFRQRGRKFLLHPSRFLHPGDTALQTRQPGLQLGQQVLHPSQVLPCDVQTTQGLLSALTVQANPRRLFQQAAAFFRPQLQHLVHHPLPDEGISPFGQTRLGQQLLDIPQTHPAPVEENLTPAFPVHASGQGHFGEVHREPAVFVVENHRHLGHAGPGPALGSRENQVLHPPRPKQAQGGLAQHPPQGVHNIGLSRAVGAYNGRQAVAKDQLGRAGEAFEAVEFDGLQASRHDDCKLQAQRAQVCSIAPGRFLRGPHTGQDVLLHHNPPLIAHTLQLVHNGREGHVPFPQFAEHPVAHGGEVVPPLFTRLLGHTRVVVLEVHMPDPVAKASQSVQGVSPTVTIMPGIQAQPQQRRVRAPEQFFHLPGSFHVSGTVVVEHHPQARLPPHRLGHPLDAFGEDFPLGRGQAVFGCDAPRSLGASRVLAVVVGQHHKGMLPHRLGHQAGHLQGLVHAFLVGLGPGEGHRNEGPHQFQAVLLQYLTQTPRLRGKEPPIPQFRALVPRFPHFSKDLGIRVRGPETEFQDAPGTRGIGHANGHLREPPSPSGTDWSRATPGLSSECAGSGCRFSSSPGARSPRW